MGRRGVQLFLEGLDPRVLVVDGLQQAVRWLEALPVIVDEWCKVQGWRPSIGRLRTRARLDRVAATPPRRSNLSWMGRRRRSGAFVGRSSMPRAGRSVRRAAPGRAGRWLSPVPRWPRSAPASSAAASRPLEDVSPNRRGGLRRAADGRTLAGERAPAPGRGARTVRLAAPGRPRAGQPRRRGTRPARTPADESGALPCKGDSATPRPEIGPNRAPDRRGEWRQCGSAGGFLVDEATLRGRTHVQFLPGRGAGSRVYGWRRRSRMASRTLRAHPRALATTRGLAASCK